MRLPALVLRILIALFVAVGLVPVSVGSADLLAQSTPIPLHQAVENGQVRIVGVPIQAGMKQPNIRLTISTQTADTLSLEILAGTVLNPTDPAFSPMIIPENVVVQVNQQVEVDLSTLGIDYELAIPTTLAPTEYKTLRLEENPRLLELFRIAREKSYGYVYEVQLAVWVTVENKSLDEIISGMQTKPPLQVQERALCILNGGNCEITPPPTTEPVLDPTIPPDTREPTQGPGGSNGNIGTFIIVALVTVALIIVATVAFLGKRKEKKIDSGGMIWDVDTPRKPQPSAPPKPDPASSLPPKPGPQIPVIPPALRQISRVRLIGSSGAFLGKTFSGALPFILSRSDIEVVVIPESTISAPHALLFLGDDGPEVKDMNSSNGVVVNGMKLPSDWQAVGQGVYIKFGKAEISISGKSFQVIAGDALGTVCGPYEHTVVISRESLNVVKLGAADANISDAHVLFYVQDNQIQIRDLSSRSGTRVNGQEATRNQMLQTGDRIQLGMSEFILQPE